MSLFQKNPLNRDIKALGRGIFGISIFKNEIYSCNSGENDKEDLDLEDVDPI